jgi:hypothetical protein
MSDDQLELLRFPTGRFTVRPGLTAGERASLIDEVERLPAQIRAAVAGLPPAQLERPYRPGGWTVRQVVHHLPDSHLNAYVRFKKAATEDAPPIMTYDEGAWATLADAVYDEVEPSLVILDGLHQRWTIFMRSLEDTDFQRPYVHPQMGHVPLVSALQLYAWHGRHHLGHIMLGLAASRHLVHR